jgi:hypothetical protein
MPRSTVDLIRKMQHLGTVDAANETREPSRLPSGEPQTRAALPPKRPPAPSI